MATTQSTPNESRAETNRANAAHSTGPRTADGKQKVRLNALRHGLFSSEIILPGEDRDAYELLGQMLLEAYGPADDYERDLLQTIHDTDWQIKRIRSLESSAHALGITREIDSVGPDLDPAVRQAFAAVIAYEKNPKLFDQFNRHSARLTRLRDSTRKELMNVQMARLNSEAAAKKAPVPFPRKIEGSPMGPGFVPDERFRKAVCMTLGRETISDDDLESYVQNL